MIYASISLSDVQACALPKGYSIYENSNWSFAGTVKVEGKPDLKITNGKITLQKYRKEG